MCGGMRWTRAKNRVRQAFSATADLPTAVRGPVDCLALARLAARRFSEMLARGRVVRERLDCVAGWLSAQDATAADMVLDAHSVGTGTEDGELPAARVASVVSALFIEIFLYIQRRQGLPSIFEHEVCMSLN